MSTMNELKMEDFWKYLDDGEYGKCHALLNASSLDITETTTRRIAVYFREQRYLDAYNCAFDKNNKCSNYAKGFAAFKHPRDIEKKEYEKYIKEAVQYLEKAIQNNEVVFYNQLLAQTMLIDSYFLLGKNEKSFSIAKGIVEEYCGKDNLSSFFDGRYQIFLIDAFNPDYTLDERNEKLIHFFNVSKLERFKTFEDIIKYSSFLKYKPDDLIDAFSSSDFSYEDGYLEYTISEETNNETEEKQIKTIWYWQFLILSQLLVSEESRIKEISHYTSQSTFDLLLQEDKKVAEFSLANANDKIEGNVLPQLLLDFKCIDTTVNTSIQNKYIAVQTSYSRNKNSLTMFRLYGKKDDKEGTGVSLVFNKNFFQTNAVKIYDNKGEGAKTKVDPRRPLFWILYYNADRKLLYFYPSEDELKPYEIDLTITTQLRWNTYNSYKTKTELKQRNLLYSFKHLFDSVRKCKNKELAIKVLYKLRYFIKSSDFAEEKELRMLDLCKPKDLKLVDNTYKLYYEYLNIFSYDSLQSIYLGPKVENKNGYMDYIKKQLDGRGPDINITPSNAPLA